MTKKQTIPLYLYIVIGATLVLFYSICSHADYINGPWYWKWTWQRVDSLRIFLSTAIFALPFFISQFLHSQKKISTTGALLWMMVAVFLGQVAICCVQVPRWNLLRIIAIVKSPEATSYFTDALRVSNVREFIKNFNHLLPEMHLHAINKPPGMILFYRLMLCWFPQPDAAALVGGLLIGVLSTLVIPATFFLIKAVAQDRGTAFDAASLMVFMPGFILFFPEFDQILPIFTCLLGGFWIFALQKDQLLYSFLFGLVLSIILFITWNVLVVGAFLAMITIYHLVNTKGQEWLKILKHFIMILFVVFGLYFFLWKVMGFNLWDTFLHCLILQKQVAPNRPYPYTILYDITDFFLGAGWLPLILGVMFFWRKLSMKTTDQYFWLCVFCYIQILFVAVFHLLPGETARVWIFLLPLFVIPAAFQLEAFSFAGRMVVFGCLWLLLGAIGQNMLFIQP